MGRTGCCYYSGYPPHFNDGMRAKMESKLETILFGVATVCAATVFIMIAVLALSAVFM